MVQPGIFVFILSSYFVNDMVSFLHKAERKKELLLFETAWMDLESIMLSEMSQNTI